MITAVVFDLDNTLAVPERDRRTLLAEATERTGAPPISREEYVEAHRQNLTERTREPVFADLLEDRETDASPDELAAVYRDAIEDALVPVPGATDLVCDLRRDYRVGVLTDGPRRAQRGKLTALGWEDLFDATVITGALSAGKPDERAFRAALDALDAAPEEAVYVGDHPEIDIEGATAAGLAAVQVVYPGGPARHPGADAHVERDRLRERLPAVIADL